MGRITDVIIELILPQPRTCSVLLNIGNQLFID